MDEKKKVNSSRIIYELKSTGRIKALINTTAMYTNIIANTFMEQP